MSPYLILSVIMTLISLLGWPLEMGTHRSDRCANFAADG